ncbi:hypothetical protein KY339_05415, partial [Candidatus Woesearchaeota archaeon]|nr:hypothetical protein [Candidatus Woesearchaeota archaeon]
NAMLEVMYAAPGEESLPTPCTDLPTCYLDRANSIVKEYKECSHIKTCYDYKSMEACELNKCGADLPLNCTWEESPSYKNFGVGVCHPTDEAKQQCGKCGEIESIDFSQQITEKDFNPYNLLYGQCDEEICTLYGACYYSNDVCSHRKDMACVDYYTNEQDCVGSTSQYSYNGEEIFADSVANSGVKIDAFADDGAQHDNSVLIPSDDFFNLNKCRWNESTFRCFKDANNDGKADCSFDDAQCQKDNEPPTTYVTPKSNVVVNITGVKRYLFGNTFFANISVYDNKPGEVTTYFCIDANYCYPLNLTANENLISHTFDVPLNQTMKMFYFSEDRAHNLEVLKSVDLFVDTIPPTITFTNKSNSRDNGYDQWFTNLNLEIFATENFDNVVYCEAKLTTVEGELIQDYNNIDDYGNYWNLTYYNLLDGNYQFHYSCTDRALNVNEGVLEIKIDGDLSLTNPLPDAEILSAGNVDIEISIISNKTADCKFDDILPVAGTIEEVYAAMENNFGVTGSTQHRHLIIIPEESRYYSYDVKCKFTAPEVPEWQRIQGNMGDRITFSVDVDSPEIQPTFVDGTVIDRKLGNPLPLYFKCNDDTVRLLSNVSGMDFGCDYVVYQLPLKDDPGVSGSFRKDYTEGEELVRIDYAGDGHEFNSSIAIPYTVYDKGGNSKSDVITLNIDTSLPEFEPVIYLGTEPKTALTSGEYKLVITSTKPLNYINPGFEVKGINIPLTFLRGTEDPLALNISTEWTFRIPLPMENPQFDIASAMARLTIEGTDLTDNTNVQQFEFEIRTRPPSKPVIQPDFKIYDERYNYPLHNYNSEDESFYTNESLLFISGFTNQHLLRIEYYVNDLLQTTYDEETQNSPEGDGELKTTTTSAAGKGDTTIRILGNLVGSPNWQPGKFIAFEEHTRESWGHYDELYEIIDITAFSAEESNIVLAQPLEYDIDQGEEISLYEKKRTYNSFGEYALLEIGENVLYLKTRDAVDLSGKTDEYKIFYDPHPPEVIEHYPPAGTIRDNMTKVWVKIKEKKIGSGLCLENCPTQHQPKLVLNGIIKQTTIETESDDFFNYYTITYDPNATNEVMDGDYEVKFIAKDFAGNELTGAAEWNFTVDMLAPTRPEFRVEGATEHNDVWYTNSLAPPTFTLEFADIEPVTVTGIYIDNRYNTANVECTRQANLFTCAFQEPLEPTYVEGQAGIVKIMNDDWDIIVTAYKTLADNTTSPEGVYGDNILVIDTIQPQFASVVDYTIDELYYTRDEINLSLPWHILNELHDLDASLTFKGTTYHLTQTGKVGENYEFVWAIPTFTSEGPGTATLRIADYAGNSVTVTGQIYIDLTPPGITLNQIEIPETIVIEGEKTTRQTVITINGLLRPEDTDIKHVYVTPGDFIGGIQYDERKYSLLEPIDRPESFTLNLVLKGEVEAVTENPINITIVDKAGYIVPQSLRVFVDLKPPAPPMVRFV